MTALSRRGESDESGPNANIRDANDAPATIPDLGKKVLAVFYSDPDVSDQNDPFADKLKAANLSPERAATVAKLMG